MDQSAKVAAVGRFGFVKTHRFLVGLLLGLTALRLLIAAVIPLSPDESYYWIWSRALALGYLDHPPMVALWIRAGTLLAGDGAFGVRLLGPFAALAGSLLLARAAEDLLPGRDAAPKAVLLLNATLLLNVGAVTMTPDAPLLFFWTLTLFAVARAWRSGQGAWWLLGGVGLGGVMTSKYTGLLLLAGLGLWLLLPAMRGWLRRPWPWVGLLLALLIFAPVIGWNAGHVWVSFVKQGGRTDHWQPGRAAQFELELIGGQLGLATPLVFALCCWGAWRMATRAWRLRQPPAALLALLTWLPAAVFLEHALGDRVQGNWPAVIYPAAVIAAADLPARWWRSAAILGLVMTGLVYLQATTGLVPLPLTRDPTLLRLAGWPDLATQVEAARLQAGASFVAADEYGIAAELDRTLPAGDLIVGVEPRWALFALPRATPRIAGQVGLLVQSARRATRPDPAPWQTMEQIGTATRGRGQEVAESYRLWRVVGANIAGRDDNSAMLPRPD
jgi:4-amino-4-deoxy-L-arabinose transferase-like glycosyltransferase